MAYNPETATYYSVGESTLDVSEEVAERFRSLHDRLANRRYFEVVEDGVQVVRDVYSLPLHRRPYIVAAQEWLKTNIATSESSEELAHYIRIAMVMETNAGSPRCKAQAVIQRYLGEDRQGQWPAAVQAAFELLRRKSGEMWNYCGD